MKILARSGVAARACRQMGISRRTYYDWMEDTGFQASVREALREAVEELEAVAMERARKGDREMLKFLLSRLAREKYGAKKELTGEIVVKRHIITREDE